LVLKVFLLHPPTDRVACFQENDIAKDKKQQLFAGRATLLYEKVVPELQLALSTGLQGSPPVISCILDQLITGFVQCYIRGVRGTNYVPFFWKVFNGCKI
jgi:hypothetical protein